MNRLVKPLLWLLCCCSLFAQIPSEEPTEEADELNRALHNLRKELQGSFAKATKLMQGEAQEEEYRVLSNEVHRLRKEIKTLEEGWREQRGSLQEEPYALWDLGETTLSQLIMEVGSSDTLYIIPQELSSFKLTLFSSLPIPRESWNELIELLLVQNGIGVKTLNPYAKQLYLLKADPSAIEAITSRESDLQVFPSYARLCHIFSPVPEQVRSVQSFFERFADPKQTLVQVIGSKLAILSSKEVIEKLLQLYHVIWEKEQGKVVRLIQTSKLTAQEVEKIVKALFADSMAKNRPPIYPLTVDDLVTLALPQGLVLIGDKDLVDRGEQVLKELECQLDDPGEKVVFWYTCKHSDPQDVAEVLSKVYDSLVGLTSEKGQNAAGTAQPEAPQADAKGGSSALIVNPPFVHPGAAENHKKSTFAHFIVDPKTASLMMVVKREELNKIKGVLKRLDVPKKMVQLDVLLVEKRVQDRSQVGVNLLRLGDSASGHRNTSLLFDANERAVDKGILNFLFSRPGRESLPAVDLTYHFLMGQENLQINANPSVLAVNQTPATISIVEEISINNGAIPIENSSGGTTFEKSFTRAQYGITISLTPTIHAPDEEEGQPGFVSLQTDITFDTTQTSRDDRPPVTRRHIVNEVRIADGETVILGGLRHKAEEEGREKIPFLGDLPGIGKLFGLSKKNGLNSEMFIFITPRIIKDPIEDLRRIRELECQKRPGDIPEFLERLNDAKRLAQRRLFDSSIQTLLNL